MTIERIYLDNSATTPVAPEVVDAMLPYFGGLYGNASSLHYFGQQSKKALAAARSRVAALVNSDPNEIVFTSGGTEADNLAVIGVAEAYADHGRHVVTTVIEHTAVGSACAELERRGWEVTTLPVSPDGLVSIDDVREAIRDDTTLVSVMHANNEIGTVQPVEAMGRHVRDLQAAGRHVFFHTDAVQSAGKVPVDVKAGCIDLLSLTAHKINGPKGVGALFVRKIVRTRPRQFGGSQERGRRPGTESVPLAVGLGAACEIAGRKLAETAAHTRALRDALEAGMARRIEGVRFNGHRDLRVPHIANVSFGGLEGEGLLIGLDLEGVAVATGAACHSGSLEPSHVLRALGIDPETIHGSLRFSFGGQNTELEVATALDALERVVARLRQVAASA